MPTTPQGKIIAARNATTHGLFARDVVLPSLGEDPGAYEELYLDFCSQLNPRNLLERHYVEKIAAASWRLRRLQRWQAQLFEDETLTEDERMDKLDKVLRHETALHRQIDTAVKMLAKDVPNLLTRRARAEALAEQGATEQDCKDEPTVAVEIELETRRQLQFRPLASDFNFARLDNTHQEDNENCQNELPEAPPLDGMDLFLRDFEKSENERRLATLAFDVEDRDGDGRPVYTSVSEWQFIKTQEATGLLARAQDFDRHYRDRFLQDQAKARALLAAA